jgi:excisionase family DNA binding protein
MHQSFVEANTWRWVMWLGTFEEKTMSEAVNSAGGNCLVPGSRIAVPEIARRLSIGRLAVYAMLDQGIIPGIRLGRRWIVTRHAYEQWERTCGVRTGLQPPAEVTVFN